MKKSNIFSDNNPRNILYIYNIKLGESNIHEENSEYVLQRLYSEEKFSVEQMNSMLSELMNSYKWGHYPDKYGSMKVYYEDFIERFMNKYSCFSKNRDDYFIVSDFNKYKERYNKTNNYYEEQGTFDKDSKGNNNLSCIIDTMLATLHTKEDEVVENNISLINSALSEIYDLTPNAISVIDEKYKIDIDWEKLKNVLFDKYNMFDEEIIEVDISNLCENKTNHYKIAILSDCDIVPEGSHINEENVEKYIVPEKGWNVGDIFELCYSVSYLIEQENNFVDLYISNTLEYIEPELPFYHYPTKRQSNLKVERLELEQTHKPRTRIDYNLTENSYENRKAVEEMIRTFGEITKLLIESRQENKELLEFINKNKK